MTSRTSRRLTLVAFAVIAGLSLVDLVDDVREGVGLGHALLEGALVSAALAGIAIQYQRSRAQLDASEQASAGLTAGLAASIDRQLRSWSLSPAEQETALLLLKGLSHKEIAAVRDVTETTARQQARAIYRKAGIDGRAELAAYFLEDLLLPTPRTSVAAAAHPARPDADAANVR